MLEALKSLFRRKQEPDVRRNLIFFDVSERDLTEFSKEIICRQLYDLACERGMSCSLVNFPDYILQRVKAAGKFRSEGVILVGDVDEDGASQLMLRSNIMWVVRHRNRLVREAFASGGEAEYVFMLFEGEPLDPVLYLDNDSSRRFIRIKYLPFEHNNLGSYAVVSHRGEHEFFKMDDDSWSPGNLAHVLDHIVKICSQS